MNYPKKVEMKEGIKIEFYKDLSGCFQKCINLKWNNHEWRKFDDLTPEEIEVVWNVIVRFPKVKVALLHLSKYFPGDKKEILRQFITCNWANLDNRWDICDKKLQFENVPCPFKSTGNCPFKGKCIVCIKI